MSIAAFFIVHAAENKEAALENFLLDMIDRVRAMPGCENIQLMRDSDNHRRFVLLEKWGSAEAHNAATAEHAESMLASLKPLLDGPPQSSHLDYIKTL